MTDLGLVACPVCGEVPCANVRVVCARCGLKTIRPFTGFTRTEVQRACELWNCGEYENPELLQRAVGLMRAIASVKKYLPYADGPAYYQDKKRLQELQNQLDRLKRGEHD